MNTNKDIDQKVLADDLRDAYNMVSPFIEKHTSIVCPDCEDICCKDKHALYDKNDLVFMKAMSVDTYQDTSGMEESGKCRNMMDLGCSLERWMRPYRCTSFFCTPLLKSMEGDDTKLYRAFMVFFKHMVTSRRILLG